MNDFSTKSAPAAKEICGWIETENGAECFHIIGASTKAAARKLKEQFPEAGQVDMECTDPEGHDCTAKIFAALESLK